MPDSDNNASQSETVRIIAEQLFETWERKQAREAKEARRWFGGNIGSFIGALAIVVSAIVAGARTHNLASDAHERSLRNETAIATLKADNSDRLARIETKIDLIMASPVK
jgi:hypothetical protein